MSEPNPNSKKPNTNHKPAVTNHDHNNNNAHMPVSSTFSDFYQFEQSSPQANNPTDSNLTTEETKQKSMSYSNLEAQASGASVSSNTSGHHHFSNHPGYSHSFSALKKNIRKGIGKLFYASSNGPENLTSSSTSSSKGGNNKRSKNPSKGGLVLSGSRDELNDRSPLDVSDVLNNSYSYAVTNDSLSSIGATNNQNPQQQQHQQNSPQKFNHSTSMPENAQNRLLNIPKANFKENSSKSDSGNAAACSSLTSSSGIGSSVNTTDKDERGRSSTDTSDESRQPDDILGPLGYISSASKRVVYAQDDPYYLELKKRLIFLTPQREIDFFL
jgi:hypothetical protein